MITQISAALPPQAHNTPLKEAAQAFEAAFLAQMLTAAGAGKPSDALGGTGESQIASFLLDAQANRMAKRGGIGIAETIIRHFSTQTEEQK